MFEPTLAAAQARLAVLRPGDYARTRNSLSGAVTRLSPYLTHGLLTMPEVVAHVQAKHNLPSDHKLLFEFGWREFFHHAWRCDGERIFRSLHAGVLPDAAYLNTLPADIREARTGLAVIDQAVRELYATGYLHNHARMWLASYVVHLRKVHWRAGADWLYAHLLDGDLASNHLSWQWVAGTGSSKPYLFNAENVAKYAPQAWHAKANDVISTSYEALDAFAKDPRAIALGDDNAEGVAEPALFTNAADALGLACFSPPNAALVKDRDVWLVHPWALQDPVALSPDAVVITICDDDFHRKWSWSKTRWQFVTARMQQLQPDASLRWSGTAVQLIAALRAAKQVHGFSNLHLSPAFDTLKLAAMPRAFVDPANRCNSFFSFWTKASKSLGKPKARLNKPHQSPQQQSLPL